MKDTNGKINKGNFNVGNSQIIIEESSMEDTLTSKRKKNSKDENISVDDKH